MTKISDNEFFKILEENHCLYAKTAKAIQDIYGVSYTRQSVKERAERNKERFEYIRNSLQFKSIKDIKDKLKEDLVKKNKSKHRKKIGFVYLIRCGNLDIYKIGISNNVNNRLSALQTAMPFDLSVVHTCNSSENKKIESMLHSKYKSFNIRGEWFNLSEEQVLEVIGIMDKYDKVFEKQLTIKW